MLPIYREIPRLDPNEKVTDDLIASIETDFPFNAVLAVDDKGKIEEYRTELSLRLRRSEAMRTIAPTENFVLPFSVYMEE